MRRVLRGGAFGALPGVLLMVVPLTLYSFDVITSVQSQIGFLGIPLLFLGALIGILTGASGTRHAGKVGLGAVTGFVAGLAAGVLIDLALSAAGTGVGGTWLFLAPAGMIAGGAYGAYRGEHTLMSRPPAGQH